MKQRKPLSLIIIICMLMVMILPVFSGAATQTVYEKELAAFPESYRSYISALQKAHPKWHFIAVDTGLDWKDVVANECVLGRNLIVNTSKPEYIDLTDVDADGKQKIRDGNNWVAASKAAVEYFLDPRNSLTDSYVFMFESLSYISDSSYTTDNIKAILKGTFMAGDFTCPDTGEVMSYADTFMEAGKLSKANPYHLAAKVRIEQGTKGNYLGLGTREGYENIFNFFNIGAYNHDGRTATENGAIYAAATGSYGRPWTNQYKALVGGAQFFASSYINVGQDTIYFEKFNVVYKDKLYKHQYMTNVQGGRSTAVSMKSGYSADVLASELYFKIPYYKNMPATPVPKPEDRTDLATPVPSTSPSVSPSVTVSATPSVTPSVAPSVAPSTAPSVEPSVSPTYSTKLEVKNGYVNDIKEGTSVDTILKDVTVSNGAKKLVIGSDGKQKSSGNICSGDRIRVTDSAGKTLAEMTLVMYGDVDADGEVTVFDIICLRKHLLEMETIPAGIIFESADVDKDDELTVFDLIIIRKHLLDIAKIA